jgi:DNA-binding NarL/FixJ family response regulator
MSVRNCSVYIHNEQGTDHSIRWLPYQSEFSSGKIGDWATGGGNVKSATRTLLIDDYEPWRRFLCSILQKETELQVIGEAADGLEAVQKAEELQPDLILLDIGLPKQNGIEAARQIEKLCPKSRILFLSEQSSTDVVQEALNTGGYGYVVKSDAGTELIAAVEAVVRGEQFVGRRFAEAWGAAAGARTPC